MLDRNAINEIANALVNTEPEQLRVILAEIPQGEPMPHIFTWGVRIPLHYLPISIELAIDDPKGWRNDLIDKVKAALLRNEKNKQLLSEWFSDFSFDEEIPYIDYGLSGAGFLYSNEIDASVETIFFVDDIKEVLASGAPQLDIQLYCVVSKFHFAEVERLLKLGANPATKILINGEIFQCLDRIGTECSFLGLKINDILTHDKKVTLKPDDHLIAELIALGANEKMYTLLI